MKENARRDENLRSERECKKRRELKKWKRMQFNSWLGLCSRHEFLLISFWFDPIFLFVSHTSYFSFLFPHPLSSFLLIFSFSHRWHDCLFNHRVENTEEWMELWPRFTFYSFILWCGRYDWWKKEERKKRERQGMRSGKIEWEGNEKVDQ